MTKECVISCTSACWAMVLASTAYTLRAPAWAAKNDRIPEPHPTSNTTYRQRIREGGGTEGWNGYNKTAQLIKYYIWILPTEIKWDFRTLGFCGGTLQRISLWFVKKIFFNGTKGCASPAFFSMDNSSAAKWNKCITVIEVYIRDHQWSYGTKQKSNEATTPRQRTNNQCQCCLARKTRCACSKQT